MAEINALIIEDEPKVADFLQRGLAEHDIEAQVAYDGLIGKRLGAAISLRYH